MCGRFRAPRDFEKLKDLYGIVSHPNFEVNPNVAPTERVPIILDIEGHKFFKIAQFGMPRILPNGKNGGLILNSRTDSIRKGAFRTAYQNRRCIIPAEGFYEWQEENGKKQPYLFERKDKLLLSLAGLYDIEEKDGEKILSFSILTTEPNELVTPFHDRMPLVLNDPLRWLVATKNALNEVEPLPLEYFSVRRMSPAMNKPQVKDLRLIDPEYDSGKNSNE